MIKKCTIIGYGNTLKNDDGLGAFIVKGLETTLSFNDINIKTMILPELDVIYAEEISKADMVIFVDARLDDSDEVVKVDELKSEKELINYYHTSHTISIRYLLGIAGEWYGNCPVCYVVMPKGYNFEIGETISNEALLAAEEAKKIIFELISSKS